jgi:site-specific DNA-methyltransferase (adenine-specific)
MRQIIFAALPLGVGVVTDTFMGSGSTVAAAEALGIQCFGVEKSAEYFEMAKEAIPKLRDISIPGIDKMLGRKKGQQTIFLQRTMTGGKSS